MAQKLILIRGLPGSGKSTLAAKLANELNAAHLEADMHFINEQGKYVFDAEKLPQAHEWCQNRAEQELTRGKTVIVANTFVRRWELDAYHQLATKLNVPIEVRVCTGRYKNIHGVSEQTISKMRQRWQK